MKQIAYKDGPELRALMERSRASLESVLDVVRPIISDVREQGDAALYSYTKRFDGFDISEKNIRVTEKEINAARSRISGRLLSAIKYCAKNIKKFHSAQYSHIEKTWKAKIEKGVKITEKTTPIESAGAYIPGGRATYPSTVLMTCIPAKIAGVKRVVVASPPPVSDVVLAACDVCGVDEIYRMGGAQAIAALAYGTKSVKRVDKIVGPGNKYVTAAKLLVFGRVDIDMPAGPSEVLIIADSSAPPAYIAADILAQAEHDPEAQSILVTDSKELADKVNEEIILQAKGLMRGLIIEKSLAGSCIVITKNLEESIDFAEKYSPEHLEIMTKNAERIAKKIRNAGTIFCGPHAPVPAGDYASGENHVLPTGGSARFSSSLSVRDFMRTYSIQEITKKGLSNLRDSIETLALAESLDAHAAAVSKRFE